MIAATNTARRIPSVAFGLSGIAVFVVGTLSHLPPPAVAVVSCTLIVLAALGWGRTIHAGRAGNSSRTILAVGTLLLLGGVDGLVRSFQENWQMSGRLPLAVPIVLGIILIWFAPKANRKVNSP